jgi:hypothetical protein
MCEKMIVCCRLPSCFATPPSTSYVVTGTLEIVGIGLVEYNDHIEVFRDLAIASISGAADVLSEQVGITYIVEASTSKDNKILRLMYTVEVNDEEIGKEIISRLIENESNFDSLLNYVQMNMNAKATIRIIAQTDPIKDTQSESGEGMSC